MADKPTHRFVGSHAETLGNGAPIGFGEEATPDLKNDHDKWLVDKGDLVPLDHKPENTNQREADEAARADKTEPEVDETPDPVVDTPPATTPPARDNAGGRK